MATEAEIEQAEAKRAFDTQERIKHYVGIIRQSWFKLAADLYDFQNADMWKHLGYDSFNAWLADPDIELGGQRSWIYQLMAIYRELVLKRGISAERVSSLPPGKLQQIMPALRRGADFEQALADVESLSFRDLRERYGSAGVAALRPPGGGGAVPDHTTTLNASTEPAYTVCPTCGSRVRETELDRA